MSILYQSPTLYRRFYMIISPKMTQKSLYLNTNVENNIALILKVIVIHHVGISISKTLNLKTISITRVSNTISAHISTTDSLLRLEITYKNS